MDLAEQGRIVTFGITPHYPETGYGYVEAGDDSGAPAIRRFVEKPDIDTARRYLAAGNFFWNSGMFAFRASVILDEFRAHQPRLLEDMRALCRPGGAIRREDYLGLPDLSIDYAVMEKTAKGVVLPSDFGWSDIGSWKSLYDFLPKDAEGNVLDGDVIAQATHNSLILARGRLIATNRLKDVVVVETPDCIFVSDMDHSRDVKSIVGGLKQRGRCEAQQHLTLYFSWGTQTLLEEKNGRRIIRLTVDPGASADLPASPGADLHVLLLNGCAQLRAGRRHRRMTAGDSLTWARPSLTRIENRSDEALEMIAIYYGGGG
jgi:mannose-1-phosphate guanylyltransferase/mannose-6-phosphate isomerase